MYLARLNPTKPVATRMKPPLQIGGITDRVPNQTILITCACPDVRFRFDFVTLYDVLCTRINTHIRPLAASPRLFMYCMLLSDSDLYLKPFGLQKEKA